MRYVAHFADGSSSPVTDLHASPAFTTGLAHRSDGKARCVFITPIGAEPDPEWIERVEAIDAAPANPPSQVRGPVGDALAADACLRVMVSTRDRWESERWG